MKSKLLSFISALIIIVGGMGLAFAMQKGSEKLPISQFYSPEHTTAVWDWANPLNRDGSAIKSTAELLQEQQINTVYTDISIYQDIRNIKDENEKLARLGDLDESLELYVKTMNAHGIAVYASGGDTSWSKPSERDIPKALLAYVHDFNATHESKFSGMEFDIESYNQEGFAEASFTEKGMVLLEYLDTVDMLATQTEGYIARTDDKTFALGFAIPYWLDNENGNIKSVEWHGKTGPALYHVLDRLNKLPQSNIVVMAYRNGAAGNDGIIFHSRTEIEYAQAQAQQVNVIIGIETTNVEPVKITFYGKTQTELSSEVKLLDEEFKGSGVYSGVAINDLAGYTTLVENK